MSSRNPKESELRVEDYTEHSSYPQKQESAGEIDMMKRELHNKDLLITNLKERLQNLEEKVNLIHREEQRDKSQQRIKDAIWNLEQKLEQFSKEREENNRKLEEIRLFGSIHSSHRLSHQRSGRSDIESLVTIEEGDDFLTRSIKTPVFEDLEERGIDLNIIA